MNAVMTDSELHKLVREALGGPWAASDVYVPEPELSRVNPVVDPSAADTDPNHPDYCPQSAAEFNVAIRKLSKDVPRNELPTVFKRVKTAVGKIKAGTKETGEMEPKHDSEEAKKTEALLRRKIREMLHEITVTPDYAWHGQEHYGEESEEDEDEPEKRGFTSMSDVGGSTFEEIAKELGFSVAGAKQAVDKALMKAKFIGTMGEDDKEILVLNAMNDYVDMLNKSGELAPADVELMKSHPDVVRELDGFREFLHNRVRRAAKSAGAPLAPPSAGGPKREPGERKAKVPAEPKAPRAPKATYRIYGKHRGAPVHTRLKGQAFTPRTDSQFTKGSSASLEVGPDGKLRVKNPDTGHEQTWDPEEG